MNPVIHTAAQPVGLVQKCSRCGAVLIDRTGEMRIEGDNFDTVWYEGNVKEYQAALGRATSITDLPATCALVPSTADIVRAAIADQLGQDIELVVDNARLVDDLNADSLDEVTITMAIEDAVAIDIPDGDAERWHRVADVVAYVERRLAEHKARA